jgi:hypothetical protein
MKMPTLPAVDAIDEEWKAFSALRYEELIPHIRRFFLDRFSYRPRYVQQRVWKTLGTVSALSKQFDLYLRLFAKPEAVCPRDCLVIVRIGFMQRRAGNSRALVELALQLAIAT